MVNHIIKQTFRKLFSLFVIFSLINSQNFHLLTWEIKETENEEVDSVAFLLNDPSSSLDSPVIINEDNWGAFNGTGGSDSPYLIENLVIDGGDGHGISISKTTYFFEIRNCTIFNVDNGIYLANIEDGTAKIYNNTIFNCRAKGIKNSGTGICIENSDEVQISNNTIYDVVSNYSWNGNGIHLDSSNYCEIRDNLIYDINSGSNTQTGQGNGIYLTDGIFNEVINNQIYNCSSASTSAKYSGNGIYNLHGDDNLFRNNTIEGISGGNGKYSGNGIVMLNSYGNTVRNRVENNSVSDVISGNSEYSGNGILIVGENEEIVESTQILNNLIQNCISDGGILFAGCGIAITFSIDTSVLNNFILNCSAVSGSSYGGNGIMCYWTDDSSISYNVIDNCRGYAESAGNGIFCAFLNYDTISFNNISNTISESTTGAVGVGNGIYIYYADETHIDYNQIISPRAGLGIYSGNGIYLGYEFDYGYIIGNTVRDCVSNGMAGTGIGILGVKDFDYNIVNYNDVGENSIAILYKDAVENRNNYNIFIGNTANSLDIKYSDSNLLEDNTVNSITTYSSSGNQIVGNLKSDGTNTEFTFYSDNKWSNFFLKITSPEAGRTYTGCGGVRLTYKWQSFGYDLDWVSYSFDLVWDSIPRPDGEIFIPWKSNGEHTIQMWSNDTSTSAQSYVSLPVTFSFEFHAISTLEDLLNITHNIQEGGTGDKKALSFWDTSVEGGDGTALYPYEIKNMNFQIPADAPVGTAGISITNTDAHFILKDCIISGGVGHYGISLQNVINARIENCTVIGIPALYDPADETAYSYPIERGIYLDQNCKNNSVQYSTFFRTLSAGIMVEGEFNTFTNNIIAPAQSNGIITSGNNNSFVLNIVAPFGGPDKFDFHYKNSESNLLFKGIVVEEPGSGNTIEDNSISNFPVFGIDIIESSCINNIIVGNSFNNCDTNISDSGTSTHFVKIISPLDGNYYTGNNPLEDGYYSGTEGFQNVDDETLPANWAYSGTGTGHKAEIIAEKDDFYDIQHKKVMWCYTGEGTDPSINVSRTFQMNYSLGTIELWLLKKGDASGRANLTFYGTTGELFSIALDDEKFWFTDNTTLNDTGQEFNDDFWYRLSIDFLNNGTYSDLNEHQYQFRIYNGSGDYLIESYLGNFTNMGNMTGFSLYGLGDGSNDLQLYLDALGYSWSPDYLIGNNIYEGMLISQSQQMGYKTWDWVGYSINDDTPISLPAFGDVVIPLPNSLGRQTLQLFVNDSSDFQTVSPLVHFSYYFNRKLDILSHYENQELVASNTIMTGGGLIKMDPATSLNISVSYSTVKSGAFTSTNASVYYRISRGSWVGPHAFGTILGENKKSFILDAGNYSLGDTVDYYLKFQQYDMSGQLIQNYFWTEQGVLYLENTARTNAFHKKVSPVPYQLSLNYSAFYQAERTQEFTTDEGHEVILSGFAPIAITDFNIKFINTSSEMTEFTAAFDEHVIDLTHTFTENSSVISESVTFPPITKDYGWISPFILPSSLELEEQITNILIPNMLFETNEPNEDNNLAFTRDPLNLTYKGVKTDWFYSTRALNEFEYFSENSYACIRFDFFTGIMVYFNYKDFTVDAGKNIYFGLTDNNQSYPINLKVEIREELNDTDQDFVNQTLDGILYDPPGDNSYSQISAGTSITSGWSLETQSGTDFQKEQQHLFFGFGFEMDEYKIDTSGEMYEFEMTHTYENSLSSSTESNDASLIGPGGGDLYYGTGTYIFYFFYVNNYYFVVNESDPVNYPYNDIRVFTIGSRIEYNISPNTSFSVLGAYLDDVGMPELAYENIFENNEISGLELQYVTELDNSPYFWTPSFVNEFGYSSSATEMSGIHSYMEYSNDTFFSWSQAISMSVGGSVGIGVTVDWSLGTNTFETSGKIATLNTWSRDYMGYETVTGEEQILVHLEDDDGSPIGEHDQFKMRIFNDIRYNSIGFLIDRDATYTSHPHEKFTGDRRPPSTCEFYEIADYLQGTVPLSVIAIDEEFDFDELNNIFKVNFYYDDDPVLGPDSILIGVHGIQDKSEFDDPEEFHVLWDCSLLQGDYYIFAEAWDFGSPMSNFYVSDPKLVHVDNIDPSICRVMAYEPYTEAINLYSFAEDLTTAISYVEYWDGDPSVEGSIILGWSDVSSNSFNYLWATDPDGSDDGWHSIYAKAFDQAGNSLISTSIQIKVYSFDSIIPSFVEIFAYGPFTGTINLYANAYDEESGISLVEYWEGNPSVNGSIFLGSSDVSSTSYNFLWITDPDGTDNGIHSICVRAYDLEGNFNVSSLIEIDVYSKILSENGETALLVGGMAVAGSIAVSVGSKLLSKAKSNLHSFPGKKKFKRY